MCHVGTIVRNNNLRKGFGHRRFFSEGNNTVSGRSYECSMYVSLRFSVPEELDQVEYGRRSLGNAVKNCTVDFSSIGMPMERWRAALYSTVPTVRN